MSLVDELHIRDIFMHVTFSYVMRLIVYMSSNKP